VPTPRQGSSVLPKYPVNSQSEMVKSHFLARVVYPIGFYKIADFLLHRHRNQASLATERIYSIPCGLNEFIHIPRHCGGGNGKPLRKFISLGNLNAMNFCSQPKPCVSFVAGWRRTLATRGFVKPTLDSVSYYLIPGEESTWRISLFVWAHGSSKLPSCCCRAVTIGKLHRS
jgi:hypothetical protein